MAEKYSTLEIVFLISLLKLIFCVISELLIKSNKLSISDSLISPSYIIFNSFFFNHKNIFRDKKMNLGKMNVINIF